MASAIRSYRGVFTSERKDNDGWVIVTKGIAGVGRDAHVDPHCAAHYVDGGIVPVGTGHPVRMENYLAPGRIEHCETPDGLPAVRVYFDATEAQAAGKVPVFEGIAIGKHEDEAGTTWVTRCVLAAVALVPADKSVNPDCTLEVLGVDGEWLPVPADLTFESLNKGLDALKALP